MPLNFTQKRIISYTQIIGLTFVLLLGVMLSGHNPAAQAQAACAAPWSATAAYTTNTQVSHVGKNWTLLWPGYTPGSVEPGSAWNTPSIWRDDGACSGAAVTATNTSAVVATATKTNTPAPTATAGGPTLTKTNTAVAPTATATSQAGNVVCSYANWDPSAANYNTGDRVTYNNHSWQAKYWTNTTPGSADWTDLGACTMPTATATWTPLPVGFSARYVIGYFPEWGVYGRDYQAADLAQFMPYLTHLQYAFVQVDTNGNCGLFDTWAADQKPGKAPYTQAGNLRQIKAMRDAVAPNVRLVLSVGGWTLSENFSDVLASASKRATMVSSCKALLDKYGWDGIDVDWEYPVEGGEHGNDPAYHDNNDTINLVSLFQEMRTAYGQNKVLSLAMGASEAAFRHVKMNQLATYVDFISLMTYDFNGAWQNVTAHNSPLYPNPTDPSVIDTASLGGRFDSDHAVQAHLNGITQANAWLDNNTDGMFDGQQIATVGGVPSTKLVMGVPFYGRSWANVNSATNQGLFKAGNNGALTFKGTCNCEPDYSELPSAMRSTYPGTQSCGGGSWEESVFDFDDIAYLDNSCGFTRGWDNYSKVPYLYGGTYSNGKTGWVSYDDAESFCYKARYALNNNLGGLMFWEVTQNRNASNTSLWKALADYRAGTPGASAGINCSANVVPTNTIVAPTATKTSTAVLPTATKTNTIVAPTATKTNTAVLPTATKTNTAVLPTATKTNTAVLLTATKTKTAVLLTATKTNTVVVPTATKTNTIVALTATKTNTAVLPTATKTKTAVLLTATKTNTAVVPTATKTNTAVLPTATKTNTAVLPTATKTNTPQAATTTPTSIALSHGRQAIYYFGDWGAVAQNGGGSSVRMEVADIVPFVNKITVINYAFIAPDANGNCYFITPDALTHVGKAPYTQVACQPS
jgi:chitinase